MSWLSRSIAALCKRRAIAAYARRLLRLLTKDYGHQASYTPQQVRKTIARSGMNTDCSCYGVAMFSGCDDFNQLHKSIGENCDYDAMRVEIAGAHFHGIRYFGRLFRQRLAFGRWAPWRFRRRLGRR
jgi:hypothetical protein